MHLPAHRAPLPLPLQGEVGDAGVVAAVAVGVGGEKGVVDLAGQLLVELEALEAVSLLLQLVGVQGVQPLAQQLHEVPGLGQHDHRGARLLGHGNSNDINITQINDINIPNNITNINDDITKINDIINNNLTNIDDINDDIINISNIKNDVITTTPTLATTSSTSINTEQIREVLGLGQQDHRGTRILAHSNNDININNDVINIITINNKVPGRDTAHSVTQHIR